MNITNFDHDLEIPFGRFFEYTFPEDLFDYDPELGPKFEVQMGSGGLWPKDFMYNLENRTISGIPLQAGIFRIDYTFTDDLGHKAYANLLLRVKSAPPFSLLPLTVTTALSFLAICIYLAYLCHWLSLSAYA